MNNNMRLAFRKGDIGAILLVLLLAGSVAWSFSAHRRGQNAQTVQVYQDARLIAELPLQTDQTLLISGEYQNTLSIQQGRAAITQSDCPGNDCVHSGWIDRAGHSLVCLPNRVEIRITGSSDVDFVVR